MSVKNAIHFFIFTFILVGVCGITAWVVLDLLAAPLSYAAIAFIWGITLAILYLAFDKSGWDWWEG